MAHTLRHPATIMLLSGLAVLGLALCCLGGSVAFTAIASDAAAAEPPAAAIICVIVGAVAFAIGVIGACIATVTSRRVTRPRREIAPDRGMSDPSA
ncbi:hypothetical protein [Microbacterium sp. ZW T5_56]|uniref:hypothetical protein n=1 Tax=Microbacterium sp. ZW T5_56 TaxID=3378081 RepID=UPI0038534F15